MTTNTTYNTTTAAAVTYSIDMTSVTVNGNVYPVDYSVTPNKTVYAFVIIEPEQGDTPAKVLRLRFAPGEDNYDAALAAARGTEQHQQPETAAQPQQQPAEVQPVKQDKPAKRKPRAQQAETTAPAQQPTKQPKAPAPVQHQPTKQPKAPAPVQQQPDQAQPNPAKQAHGPIPDKDFVGTSIKGRGWHILFDAEAQRTRVILQPKDQTDAAVVKAVQDAGFFWSPLMQSYNKKLTFRAYRAAQALAQQLAAICG